MKQERRYLIVSTNTLTSDAKEFIKELLKPENNFHKVELILVFPTEEDLLIDGDEPIFSEG